MAVVALGPTRQITRNSCTTRYFAIRKRRPKYRVVQNFRVIPGQEGTTLLLDGDEADQGLGSAR
jgi:hypothetical protein